MLKNCGASVVSSRQPGDILFYYCSACRGYKHVAIVLDGTYSIEGNYGINNVSQVAKASIYYDDAGHSTSNYVSREYVRPKYGSSPAPSNNTWVKTNKSSYSVNETVTFTFGYKYSTSVSLGIFKDGKNTPSLMLPVKVRTRDHFLNRVHIWYMQAGGVQVDMRIVHKLYSP